jgi:hypothetical protein
MTWVRVSSILRGVYMQPVAATLCIGPGIGRIQYVSVWPATRRVGGLAIGILKAVQLQAASIIEEVHGGQIPVGTGQCYRDRDHP